MDDEEPAIRCLLAEWTAATRAGDTDTLLRLMAEDIVFLTPGGPPFGREVFIERFQAGRDHYRIDPTGEFEEVVVAGDVAYARGHLSVTITSLAGDVLKRLAGYTLTVLRKEADGRWVFARDANLLGQADSI